MSHNWHLKLSHGYLQTAVRPIIVDIVAIKRYMHIGGLWKTQLPTTEPRGWGYAPVEQPGSLLASGASDAGSNPARSTKTTPRPYSTLAYSPTTIYLSFYERAEVRVLHKGPKD